MSDLIDRQAAIDAINSYFGFNIEEEYGSAVQEVINGLPSAQPERKKGKWEYKMVNEGVIGFRCSACGDEVLLPTPFCRNCGADMRGE